MFSILINDNDGVRNRLAFNKREVTIGRIRGNDVILPKGNISKRHCKMFFKGDKFIVTDLQSTNGTFVNGYKITSPTILREGDRVYIGEFILTLFLDKKNQEKEVRTGPEPTGLSPIVPPREEAENPNSESAVQPILQKEKSSTQEDLKNPSALGHEKISDKKNSSETIASVSSIPFLQNKTHEPGFAERAPSRPTEVQGILSSSLGQNPDARIWDTLFANTSVKEIRVTHQGKIWTQKEKGFESNPQIFSSLPMAVQSLQMYLQGKGAQSQQNEAVTEAIIPGKIRASYLIAPHLSNGIWVRVEHWNAMQTLDQLEQEGSVDNDVVQHLTNAFEKHKPIFIFGSHDPSVEKLLGSLVFKAQNEKAIFLENKPTVGADVPHHFQLTGDTVFEEKYLRTVTTKLFGNDKVRLFLGHLSPKQLEEKMVSWTSKKDENLLAIFSSVTASILTPTDERSLSSVFSDSHGPKSVTWLKKQRALCVYIEKFTDSESFAVTAISEMIEGKEEYLFTKTGK